MSDLSIVLLMAGVVLGIRLGGLFSADVTIPETWERALSFAPVAVLAALSASLLASQASGDPLRYLAAGGAAGIMYWSRRLWLSLLGGFAFYWILRVTLG